MPAFAWPAICLFAGAFRKPRARRSRRSSRPWRAEWDSRETICKYSLPCCQLLPSLLADARAFFENVQPDWGGGFLLPAGDNAIVYPDPGHDGVFVSMRLEVMREGIEDYELLMESDRRVPERTDALARAVMPAFTEYIRDVNQFRKFERELLMLVTEAQRE